MHVNSRLQIILNPPMDPPVLESDSASSRITIQMQIHVNPTEDSLELWRWTCFLPAKQSKSYLNVFCFPAALLTVAHQAPLSMGFPRQDYWSGLSFLPPGDLPDPGIKPESPALAKQILYHWATGDSHCCSSKWPQVWWFKTVQIYYLKSSIGLEL